jgi:alkanesulfonate monooxygenase SsuD/methylene tetrahydromethanopterin reductase-like flavin-dependent oxidoreductase (luciferase family)
MTTGEQRFGLSVDFRNPTRWPRPFEELFPETVSTIAAVEEMGFDYVWLGEHHFSEDGYAPSPLVTANAIAQHTTSIRIATGVMLLPLYHPVRFAEDVALVDVLSGGRFEPGVAVGWRPEEFAPFEIPLSERGSRTDETLEIATRLWAGEALSFHGRHFRLDGVKLMPLPVQRPHPRIWVGGYTRAALRRAARAGDGIVASTLTEAIYHDYLAELEACGKDPDTALVSAGFQWFMVSREPAKTFDEVTPYVIEWVNFYADWLGGENEFIHRVGSADDLRTYQLLDVVQPSEAVDRIGAYLARVPCHCFNIKLCPPGYPFARAREHLELFATDVMPHFR